ncbi:hypothetical protein B0H11DRAFT_2062080 [Mycena galericulata]|nr:hypothetical protein B0H11DRAFT_2062080 [Mycena galericulata]
MRLILSSRKPVHAAYKDAATGVVHYKVRSSNKLHEFVSTITRRIDVDIPRRNSGHPQAGTESDRGQAGTIGDRFGLLAQLCWYLRSPSVIRFGGEEIDPATFFRKVEMPWYVKLPVRVFTGKDGKEYKWSCSMHHTTQLRLNDGSDTLVAEYHPRSLGLISKKRDPCLEIFPPFEHMVDEILITFIYIERLRRVKRSRRDGTQ